MRLDTLTSIILELCGFYCSASLSNISALNVLECPSEYSFQAISITEGPALKGK